MNRSNTLRGIFVQDLEWENSLGGRNSGARDSPVSRAQGLRSPAAMRESEAQGSEGTGQWQAVASGRRDLRYFISLLKSNTIFSLVRV